MARQSFSKLDSGSSQSSATIGYKAHRLGVIRIIENQSRPFGTLLPKLLRGELSSNHLEQ